MFKKFTTSLSKPPLTIFFMKDAWYKVIFYVIFVTFLVVLPGFIKIAIDPSMEQSRYEMIQKEIKTDFRIENAEIKEGTLTHEGQKQLTFDYFGIYLGKQQLSKTTVNFVFEEENMVIYMMDVELDRYTYQELNLENYDFNSNTKEDIVRLSAAVKQVYEKQTFIIVAESIATYFLTLVDYIFISLFMTVLMMLFVSKLPMPFLYRFKVSLYLSTIYAVIQLILILFNTPYLSVFGTIAVYFYHVWAYRAIKIIPKGVI